MNGEGSGSISGSDEYEGSSSQVSQGASPRLGRNLLSCLTITRHDISLTGDEPEVKSPAGVVVRGMKPPAGCTLAVSVGGWGPETGALGVWG